MPTSTMPVAWHQEGLKNWRVGLVAKENALRRVREEVDRMRVEIAFYENQIAAAISEGRDAFDSGRYLKSRPRKPS